MVQLRQGVGSMLAQRRLHLVENFSCLSGSGMAANSGRSANTVCTQQVTGYLVRVTLFTRGHCGSVGGST